MHATHELRMAGEQMSGAGSPEAFLWRAEKLIAEMDGLNPFPRPRGFVRGFRTHEDYEAWKKRQPNPRLW